LSCCLTTDRRIRYQQNLRVRRIALVPRFPSNRNLVGTECHRCLPRAAETRVTADQPWPALDFVSFGCGRHTEIEAIRFLFALVHVVARK
jgi:hypothetical protein